MSKIPAHIAYLDIQIKNFDLVQLTKTRQECTQVLCQLMDALHSLIHEHEYIRQPSYAHFQCYLHYASLPLLYHRIYEIDDCIYTRSKQVLKHALFLGIGVCISTYEADIQTSFDNAHLARIMSPDAARLHTHIEFYESSYRSLQIRKRKVEQAMYKAISANEFQLYLQPKIPLKPQLPFSAEALFRWPTCPQKNMSVFDLITLAESNGCIEEIDIEMFHQVCKYQQYRQQHNHSLFPISVNISRIHFNKPNFFTEYLRIFSSYQLPTSCIEFELTESSLTSHPHMIYDTLREIKTLGFSISLDDFGCGASSLQALKEFPFTTIKLDRFLFVDENQRSRSIVKSLLQLASVLNIQCVAEGIEQLEQVSFLKKENCDYIQGYVFSPPISIPQFERYLKDYLTTHSTQK